MSAVTYQTSTQYGDTVAHALDPACVFVDKKPVVKLCMDKQEYITKSASGNSDVWVWGEEFAFTIHNSATLLELEIPESGFITIPVAQLSSGIPYIALDFLFVVCNVTLAIFLGTPLDQFWPVRHKKLDKAASFRGNLRLKINYNVVRHAYE